MGKRRALEGSSRQGVPSMSLDVEEKAFQKI